MKELGKNSRSITNHQTIEFYGILRTAILLFHKILELKKKVSFAESISLSLTLLRKNYMNGMKFSVLSM